MPTNFWDEVVYYANYLLHQVLVKKIGLVTPIEKWWSKKPLVGHLKTFGCVAWDHISDDCWKKLDAKRHVCIMMGYSEESKAY